MMMGMNEICTWKKHSYFISQSTEFSAKDPVLRLLLSKLHSSEEKENQNTSCQNVNKIC
jgi:hypothetical protein